MSIVAAAHTLRSAFLFDGCDCQFWSFSVFLQARKCLLCCVLSFPFFQRYLGFPRCLCLVPCLYLLVFCVLCRCFASSSSFFLFFLVSSQWVICLLLFFSLSLLGVCLVFPLFVGCPLYLFLQPAFLPFLVPLCPLESSVPSRPLSDLLLTFPVPKQT